MRIAFVLALLGIGWGLDLDKAVEAFEAGRYEAAQAAFLAEARRSEGSSAARLRYDAALAALHAADLDGAREQLEILREDAPARADAGLVGSLAFLEGNLAFARCEHSELLARRPESEPFLLEQALAEVGAAVESWREALISREDWPRAARNLERALLKQRELEELQRQREEQKEETPPEQPPQPPPPEPEDPRHDVQEEAQDELPELGPEQTEELLRRIERTQEEKVGLRRLDRERGRGRVERDW